LTDFGELEVAVDHYPSAVLGTVGSDCQFDVFERRHDADSSVVDFNATFGELRAASTLAVARVERVSL
jgi:hypothetical protein